MTSYCIRVATFLAIAVLATPPTDAEDWQQFRGPTGQGTTVNQDIPTHWTNTKNVRWKRELEGKGWSSPVVSGNRIYLTTAVAIGEEKVTVEKQFSRKVENPYSLRAMCLNASTSEVIWDAEVSQVPPLVSIHPKNSHASATPIVTDDRVYVHFGIYGTAALDLQGEILWKREIKFKPVHGCGGSPILHEDLLIFHCDGGDQAFVLALDRDSGKTQWKTERSVDAKRKFSFATPLVIQTKAGPTLVSPASDAVYGYDPATGKEKWYARYPQKWSIVPRPVFSDGIILVCTGYEGSAELLAIRPGGVGDVTDSHVVWRDDRFVPYNPSPIIHDQKIFLVSDNGIASCRDLQSGEIIWKKRLGGNYSASPFLSEGKIYFLSENGQCTIIEATDEYREIAQNEIDERTLSSMVPISGGVLLRTAGALYRIGS